VAKRLITPKGYLFAMCPKYYSHTGFKQQRGFLIPLALFILVVMGVMALTIARTSSQSNTVVVQEFINIQSFFAAESGAQRGMQALFLTSAERQLVDAACVNMNLNPDYSGVNGLSACSVIVSCECHYQSSDDCAPATADNYSPTAPAERLKSFYTVTSVGACGELPYRAERTIQAGAFLEQE
jgi:MSHA biogenesis protein MshP